MGFILAGAFLVIFVMVDVVWTTLTTQGSGPLTTWLTNGAKWLSGRLQRLLNRRAIMLPMGPLAIIMLGGIWLMALWLGWCLLFSAFPHGLVSAQTGLAADNIERIYYVGFTLSTLGVGDFKPTADITRLLTVFASFNGLIIVTLVITYALPLVQAAVLRRKLAFTVSLLGKTPQEIAAKAFYQEGLQVFESTLQTVANELMQCSEQRLAYPVLDLFYCRQPGYSLGLQVAKLDEALSLLALGLQPDDRLPSYLRSNVQEVIEQYLYRVESKAFKMTAEPPPLPSTKSLAERQLPLLAAEEIEAAFASVRLRRLRLRSLVLGEGWQWFEVDRRDSETYLREE